jgi:integrase
MIEDLRLRNLADSTRDQYVRCVATFAKFHGRSPHWLGQWHVREFLLHLANRGLAPATRKVYFAAIGFLYIHTLGRPEVMANIPRPRKGPDKEPRPLTREEVKVLLDSAASCPFDYTFLATLLATGLRVTAACRLRTDDIDSRNGLLAVRNAKGRKNRIVRLGDRHLQTLRRYWCVVRPPGPWIFPAQRLLAPGRVHPTHRWADHPVSSRTISLRLHKVRRRSGLVRNVTPHDLRRTYATWLIEEGVDLRTVQVLLGHASPNTTARYTRVRPELIRRTPSPLDLL